MNYAIKSLKLPLLLGILIAFSLIFNACSTGKNGAKIKTVKNWITWKLQFKPGTNNENIGRTKTEIDQYITDYINKTDPGHQAILLVTITYQMDFSDMLSKGTQFSIIVSIGLDKASQGVRVPPAPGPPPVIPGVFDFK